MLYCFRLLLHLLCCNPMILYSSGLRLSRHHPQTSKVGLKEQKGRFLHFEVAKVRLKEQKDWFLLFGASEVRSKEQIGQFLHFGSKPGSFEAQRIIVKDQLGQRKRLPVFLSTLCKCMNIINLQWFCQPNMSIISNYGMNFPIPHFSRLKC